MSQITSFEVFYPYVLGYMIAYMPTLALVNSISFHQMSDTAKEFSSIRVFGTVGWILAGMVISYLFQWDSQEAIAQGAMKNTFLMTAAASALLGVFSFTLPKTPPSTQKENVSLAKILGLDALSLLKERNFLIFFIASVLICIPLAFYYQNAAPFLSEIGMANPAAKMSIGQISEALFILALPVFFKRFGFKKTILIGMLAWGVRYLLFAYGDVGEKAFMLLIGIALHGICYDFFFVSGQIYTDAKASEENKSAAQGLITLATYGVGMLIGFEIAGGIADYYLVDEIHDWKSIWQVPAVFAVLVFVLFSLTFKDEKIDYNS
jgi:nucleoside transporter